MTRSDVMAPRFRTEEAVNRSMDRLMATATFGQQPRHAGPYTEIRTKGTQSDERVSVALRQSDIEAVLAELEEGAPCGICGHDPCVQRKPDA